MVDEEAPTKGRVRKSEQKQEDSHTTNSDDIVADSGDSPGDTEDSDNDNSSSSTDIDDFTFDLAAAPSSERVVHGWGEVARDGHVPHSEETSHRLAMCNMDWDRLSANDVFGE